MNLAKPKEPLFLLDVKDPKTVKQARALAGKTQKEAAATIHYTLRAWQQFELGEREISTALWELFLIKEKLPYQP